MATKPYDPINSIEGMFNGCITRIGQAIKDPLNFGASTKGVLFECSKRYQDALDDCAIQILDAKFYLEHQLAQNRARREAKAREESVAIAKRKHEQIRDTREEEETAKRVKVEDAKPISPEQPAKQPNPSKSPKIIKTEPKSEATAGPPTPKPTEPPRPASPKPPDKEAENLPEDPTPSQPLDDFPKPTPNATPAPTNDDFNFESMFGEPSADAGAGDTDDLPDDLPFDLDLGVGDTFAATLDSTTDAHTHSQDLNSLLPGLESYANQAGDDAIDGNNVGNMSFDLPPLPNLGPNDFDAFLDANDFTTIGGGGGGGGAGPGMMNLNDDPMGNLDDMNNLDFDSMFNN